MSNPVSKLLLAAIFIYILTVSAVWADRILIDDPEQTVTVSQNFSCYRPVDITVDTANPGLYDANSRQLQKLADGVRAILSYECPGLSSIQLTGLIRGLDEVVYQGEMIKNNSWLVGPLSTASQQALKENRTSQAASLFSTHSSVAKRYDDELKQGQLEVTGLQLGMSVEEVSELVFKTFGVAPQYDAEQGVLTMNPGDCPAQSNSAPGETAVSTQSKCLQAWFSDNRVARLERLKLLQVVDGQLDQVNSLLVKKYGNPTQTVTSHDKAETQMVWRAINDKSEDDSVIQEIDAIITAIDGDFVSTNVTLYSTQVTNSNDDNYADLDLKL